MEDLAKRLAAGTGHKAEILAADLTDSNDLAGVERILRAARYATVRAVRRGVYV
jgi:short-subunit dehydrogenase